MSAPVNALLLAAGESTRMGEPKALLPWDGRPLLQYAVDQLIASPVKRVAVVLGHQGETLRALLPRDPRLQVVDNSAYREGKVSSILAGVAVLPPEGHVLVLGVDQPRPASLLTRVIEVHLEGGALITVASFGERRGHPVIFAPSLRAELLALEEATEGLRAVLRRHADSVRLGETGSPLALTNLNTPADVAAARALLA
jgi:CTP:molybdopterin cytidylyltransferase MocA